MPGKFTLNGKVNQVGKDGVDAGIDQDKTVATGWTATLKSNYPKGVPLPDGSDIDYIDERTITLLSDGSITEDGTNPGISLTAHDPDLFSTPLQWTVKPGPVTLVSGKTLRPKPWTFNAPLDGASVTLGGLVPVADMILQPVPGAVPWDDVSGKPAFIAAGATVAEVQAALGVDKKKPMEAGTFPWPQGLVALWDFQQDTAGGTTVTSRVGSQVSTLTALASKTVVKDSADPGPFGPSLVLDGATAFAKVGGLGALDVSVTGDEVTVIAWVKDTLNAHEDASPSTSLSFRAGSHNDGSVPSRQYGIYVDSWSATRSRGRLTPHIGAQDGPTPGYIYNYDSAASARRLWTTTGQGGWHMEAMTFDGAQLTAYIDGMTDLYSNAPEGVPDGGQTATPRVINRNPYPLRKGINRSTTVKVFSIGASGHWNGTTNTGFAYTTGKLGGVAVFNRALSAVELMQIRLATLLSGEAITTHGFEVAADGLHTPKEIGWTAVGSANNLDVSSMIAGEYTINRSTGGQKSYLKKTSTAIGAASTAVTGLNSWQVRTVKFKMLSAATGGAAQRILAKVGSSWWASKTSYTTSSTHSGDTDWSGAEQKTLAVSWEADNWYPVTMTPTGGTATFQNLAKNSPALNIGSGSWFTSASAAHATSARVASGGGFVWRTTWTGTDGTVSIGGLLYTGVGAITAGNVYSGALQVTPSKYQKLQCQLMWYDASNNFLSLTSGAPIDVGINTPTILPVTGTAPASATQVAVRVNTDTGGTSWVNGDTLDTTNCIVVAGAFLPPTYFDGDTAGAAWDGSVSASTSTYTNMPTGVLSLGGATNTAAVDNALITAIGFLSSGGDGSAVRVSDLELLPV